jgi:hypothetical protein
MAYREVLEEFLFPFTPGNFLVPFLLVSLRFAGLKNQSDLFRKIILLA